MKKLLLIFFSLLFSILVNSQDDEKIHSDTLQTGSTLSELTGTVTEKNFFDEDDPLKITLKYDISSFIKNKRKGEYLDAILEINYEDQEPVVKNIRLKARGNYRRGQCYFPPIYLNFKTDPIENTELEGVKKIKVVSHCVHSKTNRKYILREFLAYKMYNVLSANSFRVRLLDINYIDTGKKKKTYHEIGFIIEPLELVAKRNNAVIINPRFVKAEDIIEESADMVALFEYMIGNTDWRFKSGHNVKYLKSLDQITNKVIAIPYDFDFSGFVNTNYSFPQEWTSVDNVRQREFLGYCRDNDNQYLEVLKVFEEKQNEIIQAIKVFPHITEKEKKYLIKYINEFNTLLFKPENFIATMKRECRTNF